MQNLWGVFLTGLFTGGLTCLAVQGGLLATAIAQTDSVGSKDQLKNKKPVLPVLIFLGAKLIAYTFLGFVLGLFGSAVQFSLATSVILQFVVGFFMLGTALNFLNVHPVFRYFILQPPRFITRIVRNQARSKSFFTPALLGAFTIFIPCGTTQAMIALAVASGNPILGSAILLVFTLGTSPLFFFLGYSALTFGSVLKKGFIRLTAAVLIFLAVISLNGALALTGSAYTLDNLSQVVYCRLFSCGEINREIVQEQTIEFNSGFYSPNIINVKTGTEIKLKLVNNNGAYCMSSFVIPALGILRNIPYGATDTVEFTAPEKPGRIAFMCGMGMYRGIINVVEKI